MDNEEKILIGAAAIGAFLLYFSRCPTRTPEGEGLLSPSDGIIVGMEGLSVLIYLSLFDVHCQRAPCSGTVIASQNINEVTIVDTDDSIHIVSLRQGTVGRSYRIKIMVNVGDTVVRGQTISHIRLGSMVRFSMPEEYVFTKSLGDIVFGGRTVIAVQKP